MKQVFTFLDLEKTAIEEKISTLQNLTKKTSKGNKWLRTYLKLKSLFALNISFILYKAFKGVVVDQAILRKLIVKNKNETDAV